MASLMEELIATLRKEKEAYQELVEKSEHSLDTDRQAVDVNAEPCAVIVNSHIRHFLSSLSFSGSRAGSRDDVLSSSIL